MSARVNDWQLEIRNAVVAFVEVAQLAQQSIGINELRIEFLEAPHKPHVLPTGSMAVYAFWWNGTWLKIGKAGPNSGPRYLSQHYTGNALSTLAGSLVRDQTMRTAPGFDPDRIGEWIKKSTSRVNILMSADRPTTLLSLLEAFLHARLRPRYEG